jgi:hypothetical protein
MNVLWASKQAMHDHTSFFSMLVANSFECRTSEGGGIGQTTGGGLKERGMCLCVACGSGGTKLCSPLLPGIPPGSFSTPSHYEDNLVLITFSSAIYDVALHEARYGWNSNAVP